MVAEKTCIATIAIGKQRRVGERLSGGTNPLELFRQELRKADSELADSWACIVATGDEIRASKQQQSKWINDPIWKTVKLDNHEVAFIDHPFFQRMRRVRQLGLAYLVYPGAHHTRFEHCIGAMEAATRVLDRFYDGLSTVGFDRIRRVVRLAALAHDIGHPAFSHLGERVLERLYRQRFRAIGEVFRQLLSEYSRKHGGDDEYENDMKPAELASALFLVDPTVQRDLCLHYAVTPDDLVSAIALILGGSANFRGSNNERLDFVDYIISGDMDVDKIDYVARDAYFAGIPVSSDVERLINQLGRASTLFGGRTAYLFGVRRAGISPLEMFVLTRAYLFDRLYRHPKIRSAEALLERELLHHLMAKSFSEALTFMYCQGGDDACLFELDKNKGTSVLARSLPERALALTPRTMQGHIALTNETIRSVLDQWSAAEDELRQTPTAFEALVISLADVPKPQSSQVIAVTSLVKPIEEEPEVWIAEGSGADAPRRVNEDEFDVEKFTNAYQDRHSIGWLFAPHEGRFKVAAAGAVILHERYGLTISRGAIERARVGSVDFQQALSELKRRAPSIPDRPNLLGAIAAVEAVLADKLHISPRMIAHFLPKNWSPVEKEACAARISDQLNALDLNASKLPELDDCLRCLRILLDHAESVLGSDTAASKFSSEEAFHKNAYQFAKAIESTSDGLSVEMKETAPNGYPDLVFRFSSANPKIAVELKSEPKSFDEIVGDWSPQAEAYSSNSGYSYFSVLYVECLNPSEKAAELIRIVQSPSVKPSPLVTICIPLRRQGASASARAKELQKK